ncbi:MAG: hypothetical protein AAF824_14820 [Bacteroidota bacterium]
MSYLSDENMLEVQTPMVLLREYPTLYVRQPEYQFWIIQLHKLLEETAEAQMQKLPGEKIEDLLTHFLIHTLDISFLSLGKGQFLYKKGRATSVLLQLVHPDNRGDMISRRELQRTSFIQLLHTVSSLTLKQFPAYFLITNVYEWYLIDGRQLRSIFRLHPLPTFEASAEEREGYQAINKWLGRHLKTFYDTLRPWNWNLYGFTDILQEQHREVPERLLSSFSLLKNSFGIQKLTPGFPSEEALCGGHGPKGSRLSSPLFIKELATLDEIGIHRDLLPLFKHAHMFTSWHSSADWVIGQDIPHPVDGGRLSIDFMRRYVKDKALLPEGKQHTYFRLHIEDAILEYMKTHHSVWEERVKRPQDTFLLSRKESNEALQLLRDIRVCDLDIRNAYLLRTFVHSLIHLMATYGLLRLPGGAFVREGELWWDGINWQINASQERQFIIRKALYKQLCYTYTQQVVGICRGGESHLIMRMLIWIDLCEQAKHLPSEKASAILRIWEVACKHLFQKSALPYRIHLGMGIDKVRELQSYTPDGGQMEWRVALPELWDDESQFKGFDIVLSQPAPLSCTSLDKEEKTILKLRYDAYAAQGNQACCMVELGQQLTHQTGSTLAVLPARLWTSMAHQRFQDYLDKWVHEVEEIPEEQGTRKDLCLLLLTHEKVKNPAGSRNQGLLFRQ